MRVPRRPTSDGSLAFKEVIRRTAKTMHEADVTIEYAAICLFEQIAEMLTEGKVVTLNGFGSFGSRIFYHPNEPAGMAIPQFVPARALRHELRTRLIGARATGLVMKRLRKRHRIGGHQKRAGQMVTTTLEKIRESLVRDNFDEVPRFD